MCGPPDDSYDDSPRMHQCSFCKEWFDRYLNEIARPVPPYGEYKYVWLCDACYKPYQKKDGGDPR